MSVESDPKDPAKDCSLIPSWLFVVEAVALKSHQKESDQAPTFKRLSYPFLLLGIFLVYL